MKVQFRTYLDKDHRYQLVRRIDKKVICLSMSIGKTKALFCQMGKYQ